MKKYNKPDDETLKKKISGLSYMVTQHGSTEPRFSHPYNDQEEAGIYVDIVTGQPLFSSKDKYDAGCGWPSFTRPLDDELLKKYQDRSTSSLRIEVKSSEGLSHLGHVFNDGPEEEGGLRYCINGAALRFIPKEDLVEEGYPEFISLFENKDQGGR